MLSKTKTLLLSGILVLAGAPLLLAADEPKREHRRPNGGPAATQPRPAGNLRLRMLHAALGDLNLSEDQKAKIKPLMADFRQKMETWLEANKEQFEALHKEVQAAREAKDKAKLAELQKKGQALWATSPSFPDLVKSVREVLTPEQQTQFDAKVEEIKKRVQEDRQHMGPGSQTRPRDGRRHEGGRREGRRGNSGGESEGAGNNGAGQMDM